MLKQLEPFLRGTRATNAVTPRYFLCAGVGRSGTTALRLSLGMHPQIYYNGKENNVLTGILFNAWRNCTEPDRRVAMVVSQEKYDRAFERLCNDILFPQRDQHAGKLLMAACDLRDEVTDYLYQVLPGTKMLYLIRNGIEVVASRALFPSMKEAPFEEHCDIWLRAPKIYAWGKARPEQVRFFRHEWLRDETRVRAELSSLYDWLGIKWADALFQNLMTQQYHPTQHPTEPAMPELSQEKRAKQEVEMFAKSRQERWMLWSDRERALFEEKCGGAMRELGYEIPWRTHKTMDATDRQMALASD